MKKQISPRAPQPALHLLSGETVGMIPVDGLHKTILLNP
jgi:hypothetical protein